MEKVSFPPSRHPSAWCRAECWVASGSVSGSMGSPAFPVLHPKEQVKAQSCWKKWESHPDPEAKKGRTLSQEPMFRKSKTDQCGPSSSGCCFQLGDNRHVTVTILNVPLLNPIVPARTGCAAVGARGFYWATIVQSFPALAWTLPWVPPFLLCLPLCWLLWSSPQWGTVVLKPCMPQSVCSVIADGDWEWNPEKWQF